MENQELDYITVRGFKSIASIERLELRPINVLIGPNGSGKSNFIGAFSFLHALREGRLQSYVRKAGGAEQLLHFGSKTTKEIHLEISFKNGVNKYQVWLKPTDDDSLYPENELAAFQSPKYSRPYTVGLPARGNGREAGISNPDLDGTANWVRDRLSRWRLYHVHDTSSTSPMRKTAQLNDMTYLRPDGSNLPAFLYFLRQKHSDAYSLIRRIVQRVAPFFDDFILSPDQLNEETIRLAWKHRDSDQFFGASALSDGSLRFITLATLFLQPPKYRPSIIIVDEPELGLHPSAISLLASMVKQASEATQVVMSTQSSLLLDHFAPEDVLVAERVGGGTKLSNLNPERLASWFEDYSLGQLWEKNEIGGRPEGR